MNIIDIINKKKIKLELTKDEIDYFINGFVSGEIKDYQMSALLMAILINGMTVEERINLTMSMVKSGTTLEFDNIDKIVVDKHSTGGVGDKTSLVLIPLLATLGYAVSKMSGRGLGHTGGTIDKLESYKGFSVEKTKEEIYKQIDDIGCVIVGQSDDIVPADKIIYALRDVTGTVDSIALIASSIMSKKIALGAQIILLDVKYGNGAFMKTKEDAEVLAEAMIEIGNGLGRKTIACITSMEQPLGKNIGNALEIEEAIDTLNGKGNVELYELCIDLASEYLIIDKGITKEEAKNIVIEKINSKKAYEVFNKLLIAQGVDKKDIDDLPKAQKIYEYKATTEGYIQEIIANKIGNAAMMLGAGRKTKEDILDLSVGLELLIKVGENVKKGETIALVHYNDEKKLKDCLQVLENAYVFSKNEVQRPKLIDRVIK